MSFFEFPHTRTYDSDLGWLIKGLKSAEDAIHALEEWSATVQPTLNDFKSLYEALMSGTLPAPVSEGIEKWLSENAIDLIGELVKMVFFGITDDGYFVAYIPESWDDIIFNTVGLDLVLPGYDYGTLVLSY